MIRDDVAGRKYNYPYYPDTHKGVKVGEVQKLPIRVIGRQETVNLGIHLINAQFDHMGQLQGDEEAHDAEKIQQHQCTKPENGSEMACFAKDIDPDNQNTAPQNRRKE